MSDQLSTARKRLRERPVVRALIAAVAAAGLAFFSHQAVASGPDPIYGGGDGAQHWSDGDSSCKTGCDPDTQVCCG